MSSCLYLSSVPELFLRSALKLGVKKSLALDEDFEELESCNVEYLITLYFF